MNVPALLRSAYVEFRSEFESHRCGQPVIYVVPRRYDGKPPVTTTSGLVVQNGTESVWPKIARRLQSLAADPVAYVRAQFLHLLPDMRPPEPPQLASEACIARWLMQKRGGALDATLRLESQRRTVRAEVNYRRTFQRQTTEQALAATLGDPNLLSPLFRYCIATQCRGLVPARIAARLRPGAVKQFNTDPDNYLDRWAEILPDGFPE